MMVDETANVNVEPLKLFVGGLSWDSTKESMKQHFSQFGEVSDTVVMLDNISKKPRGFGFVTFEKKEAVARALAMDEHILDNKTIDPKPATTKGVVGPSRDNVQVDTTRHHKKIFVGGLPAGTTEKDVKDFFSAFGTVTDVDIKVDKASNRMRGFGFVEFEDSTAVDKVVVIRFHTINHKSVEAKRAQPRAQTVSRNGSFPEQNYSAGQDYTSAYGRSANYTYYAHQFSSQAAAAAVQQQYYGPGQYPYTAPGYPTPGYQVEQQQYTGGQQGPASLNTQQIPAFTASTNYAASNTRSATGYTGSESYPSSYSYPDNRAQAAQTSGYQQQQQQQQQQHYDNQGYQRSMGQRSNYDYPAS